MFTVKLKRNSKETYYTVSTSCLRYDVDQRDGCAFIVVHKDHVESTPGTEFLVGSWTSGDPKHLFDVAFIENQAGKTIDRIGPFS